MKKTLFIFATLFFAFMLAGCGSQPVSTPKKQAEPDPNALQVAVGNFDVIIKDLTFQPADINIEKGTTVVWTNEDTANHIVVSDSELSAKLMSPDMKTGDKYFYTFDQPGKYEYYCLIHPEMKGVINVK